MNLPCCLAHRGLNEYAYLSGRRMCYTEPRGAGVQVIPYGRIPLAIEAVRGGKLHV